MNFTLTKELRKKVPQKDWQIALTLSKEFQDIPISRIISYFHFVFHSFARSKWVAPVIELHLNKPQKCIQLIKM